MKITIEIDSISELLEVSRAMSKIKTAVDADMKRIAELGINIESRKALLSAGVSSLEELAIMTDADLLKIPCFGRSRLAAVREALARLQGGATAGGEGSDKL